MHVVDDRVAACSRLLETPLARTVAHSSLIGACVLMALVPYLRISTIVLGSGANNPSNDYLGYVGLVDRILNGQYDWSNYFRDTMVAVHSLALPFLARLAIVRITHWNIYAELTAGLILAAAHLILFFDALTSTIRRPERWLVLPILAALTFSTSQISVYGYGDASLPIGFTQLGLALGVWAIARFPHRWYGPALAGVGGIMATLSGAGGLSVWPAFLIGILVLAHREIRAYAVLGVAATVATLPYTVYLLVQHRAGTTGSGSLFDISFVVAALGWPFSQGFSTATASHVGRVCVLFLVIGLFLLWLKRRSTAVVYAAPSLMVLTYGLLNTWLISIGRGNGALGLAPWYTSHFVPVWIGMVGLAYVIWVCRTARPHSLRRRTLAVAEYLGDRVWTPGLIAFLAIVYLQSNVTEADKAMYLYSRTPASAECLRNYVTAPTTCEQYVYQWGVGRPRFLSAMAVPLDRHHLSTFAPDEQWSLQGDYVLDTVRVEHPVGAAPVSWSPSDIPLPWTDYRHVDMVLPAADSVRWTVALPANLVRGTLDTAVRNDAAALGGTTSHIVVEVGGTPVQDVKTPLPSQDAGWHDVTVPLNRWRGRTITLVFSSSPDTIQGSQDVAFRYPVINVHLDVTRSRGPVQAEVVPGRHDYHFDLGANARWTGTNMKRVASGADEQSWKISGDTPSLAYRGKLSVCLNSYSDLYLRLAIPPGQDPATVKIELSIDSTGEQSSVVIPLFADGQIHAYFYSLKLFQLAPNSRLSGIVMSPTYTATPGELNEVRIGDLRLVRDPYAPGCNA